jgi:hypothetical protein
MQTMGTDLQALPAAMKIAGTSWKDAVPALARVVLAAVITGMFVLAAGPTSATVWTDWTSATVGTPGSAAGTLDGVAVTYTGEVRAGTVTNGTTPIWAPNSSFIGGTVTTSPSTVGDAIFLNGVAGTDTITFASPIVNPVFAIWSLGAPGLAASFTFNVTPTFEAGGPNAAFGGGPISVAGNVVSGREGNGVVQFTGTFSSISWTDTPENFYGFTVGTAGSATAVPEPSTFLLLGSGLSTLAGTITWRARRRK